MRQTGNIEDLKKSSEDRVSLTLIKKDYTGRLLDGIKLNDSLIAKCIFNEAKIYNCTFTNCEFTKDEFVKASFMGVDFNGCTFYSANFAGCSMSHVKFDENCKFVDSKFDNINMTDNVTGLSVDDKKIISEQAPEQAKIFTECGFIGKDDGTYENEYADRCKAIIYHDPEMLDLTDWRMTFYCNDEAVFTSDFSLDEDFTKEYLNKLFKDGIKIAERKAKELAE